MKNKKDSGKYFPVDRILRLKLDSFSVACYVHKGILYVPTVRTRYARVSRRFLKKAVGFCPVRTSAKFQKKLRKYKTHGQKRSVRISRTNAQTEKKQCAKSKSKLEVVSFSAKHLSSFLYVEHDRALSISKILSNYFARKTIRRSEAKAIVYERIAPETHYLALGECQLRN